MYYIRDFATGPLHIFHLSILLLTAIRAKLLGPHTGLQVGRCRGFAFAMWHNIFFATKTLHIFPLSIQLLAIIKAKRLGSHIGHQVGKCRGFAVATQRNSCLVMCILEFVFFTI